MIALAIAASLQRSAYAKASGPRIPLAKDQDGTILSTKIDGGFIGTTLGLFAEAKP